MRRSGFNDRENDGGPNVPPPSDICGIPGCKNDSSFAMMKVSGPKGLLIRVCSDVAEYKYINGTPIITMRGSYNFVSWFVRCPECLQEGIRDKAARQQIQQRN